MGAGGVVTGTKDEGLFREMWVYSSLSGGSGALFARMRGIESWKGRRSEVNRKVDDDFDGACEEAGEPGVLGG